MKLVMVAALTMLAGITRVRAQEQRIVLDRTELSAGELFAEIEKQSGLLFAVNHGNFDTSRIVSVPAEADVTELVRLALAETPMTYRISGRHILIVSRREEKQLKLSKSAPPQTTFYDIRNRQYDNPDFERDLAVYNASVAGSYVPDPDTEPVTDSVMIIYVPRVDSVFTYADAAFALERTKTRTALPVGAGHLEQAPAKFALKINLLYAATLTPNLSFEVGLGRRTSLDLTGSYNAWNRKGTREDNCKLVHWTVRPEFRYWLCERSNGHFFGVNAFYWQYNIGGHNIPLLFKRDYRYEGYAVGGGISYGYHLPIARNWGVEFSVGAGVSYFRYDRFGCLKCSRDGQELEKIYFGPTNLGIKLVFIIK